VTRLEWLTAAAPFRVPTFRRHSSSKEA
jgi:hypothetical protein